MKAQPWIEILENVVMLCHLMVKKPRKYMKPLSKTGADSFIVNDKQADPEFHLEAASSKFSHDIATDIETQLGFWSEI